MKKFFSFFAMIILISLIGGCDKETPNKPDPNDNNGNTNPEYYVLYDGTYYAINKTVVYSIDQFTGFTQFTVFLAPPTVTYNSLMESLTGTGSGIRLTLWLPENATSIPSGIYNTPESPYIEIDDITNCAFLNNNATWNSYSSEGITSIPTGVLTVENNSSEYTIDFEGFDEEGEEITAHYKGSIQIYEGIFK